MTFTCEFKWMNPRRLHWRCRLIFPYPVHQIGNRAHVNAAAVQILAQCFQLARRMKPGIKPDHATLWELFAKPRSGLHVRPWHRRVVCCDLRLHLRAVTAVNKNTGNVFQRNTEPGGPGETGQPRQPLVMCGDILTLMGIRARHKKTVQVLSVQYGPQGRQPWRTLFRPSRNLKRLEHVSALLFLLAPNIARGASRASQPARRIPMMRARARGLLSKSAASCSVMAPASWSTSVMVTARS